MTLAFTTFARALRLIYQNIFPLIWLSVFWLVCSLPLVTLPAATAALYAAVHELVAERDAKPRAFFADMRVYFWRSWQLFLIDGILLGTSASAAIFYLSQEGWLQFAALPPLYLLLFFMSLQMYLFPLLVGQTDKSASLILRNAFVLLMRQPLFTLTLTVVMLIWVLICILLNGPLLLVAISASAFLQCLALKTVLPLVTMPGSQSTGQSSDSDEGQPSDTPSA